MAKLPQLAALILAGVLGACAQLSAHEPLFTVADQIGPPPMTEGIWIAVGEECPEHNVRRRGRFPAACGPLELRRAEDGAWTALYRLDLMTGLNAEERAHAEEDVGPYRVIIAPAVPVAMPDAYAPLYVAEFQRLTAEPVIGYYVLAPVGALPATTVRTPGTISCLDIFNQGPIEGIEAHYDVSREGTPEEHRSLEGCTASTQDAVREAARRALIENIELVGETRLVFVRPR